MPVHAHHDDLVAHGQGFALVMGDVGHGQLQALLQAADFLAHLAAQAGIEVAQGLVEQQHGRLQHQGARQRHALLLAAREFAGQALVVAHQADVLQRVADRARAASFATPDIFRPYITFSCTFMCGNSA